MPAPRLRDFELLHSLFLFPAVARTFPVEACIDHSPIQIAFGVLPDIRRKLAVDELEVQTLNDILRICLLLKKLAGCGKHEIVVLNEKLLGFSFAMAFIAVFSISRTHFPSLRSRDETTHDGEKVLDKSERVG